MEKKDLEKYWENFIYPPKQLGNYTLDLTVKKVYSLKNQGALDFGGSEYQPSKLKPLIPEVEDDPKGFGWWSLSMGSYVVEYNETLPHRNCLALVYPHQRLQNTGCFHTPFIVDSSNESQSIKGLLVVSVEKVRIKENARISRVLTLLVD